MFASHLWVRAAAVMSGGAEEPSPVKAFLSPLNLVEYRNLLKEQGYDDPGPGVIMIVPMSRTYEVPGADVPTCPGSTARGRDSPGRRPAPGSARGRDSLGLRVAPVRHSL